MFSLSVTKNMCACVCFRSERVYGEIREQKHSVCATKKWLKIVCLWMRCDETKEREVCVVSGQRWKQVDIMLQWLGVCSARSSKNGAPNETFRGKQLILCVWTEYNLLNIVFRRLPALPFLPAWLAGTNYLTFHWQTAVNNNNNTAQKVGGCSI